MRCTGNEALGFSFPYFAEAIPMKEEEGVLKLIFSPRASPSISVKVVVVLVVVVGDGVVVFFSKYVLF